MKDEEKSREQLIEELSELRQQIASFQNMDNPANSLKYEDMYFSLIAQALFGYYIIQDDRFRFVNPRTAEIFGYTVEEMLTTVHALDVAHDDDKQLVADNMRRRLSGEEESIHYILKGIKKDKTPIDIQVLGSRIMYRGRPAVQGNMLDITEAVRTKNRLEETRRNLVKQVEYYNSLIDNLNEGFCSTDVNGNITFYNKRSWQVLDYETKNIVGSNIMDFVPSEYEKQVLALKEKVLGQGKGIKTQVALLTRDGSKRIYQINASPIFDDGVVTGGMILADDITSQKAAEQALAEEKERLAVTLRSIGDGVVSTNIDGQIVLINEVAEDFIGCSQSEMLGKNIGDFIMLLDPSTGRPRGDTIREIVNADAVIECPQCILINRSGHERMVSVSGAPIRDRDDVTVGVVMVISDITEILRIEEERARTGKLESLGVLAGGIAHDFNNLLTVVLGNITLVRMNHDVKAECLEQLDEAEKACLHAKELTKQLLTFARGGTPVKRPCSVETIIRDAAGFALTGSSTRCEFNIPNDLWQVNIDSGQISQVMNNLIINAAQAMGGFGTVKIRVSNVIVTGYSFLPLAEGFYVKIAVEDTGEGISEENQQKIYDPYFTTKTTGSGLGLATSYTIIRNHEGHISVRSTPGQGAVFSVYLPAIYRPPLDLFSNGGMEPD